MNLFTRAVPTEPREGQRNCATGLSVYQSSFLLSFRRPISADFPYFYAGSADTYQTEEATTVRDSNRTAFECSRCERVASGRLPPNFRNILRAQSREENSTRSRPSAPRELSSPTEPPSRELRVVSMALFIIGEYKRTGGNAEFSASKSRRRKHANNVFADERDPIGRRDPRASCRVFFSRFRPSVLLPIFRFPSSASNGSKSSCLTLLKIVDPDRPSSTPRARALPSGRNDRPN